MKYDEIINEEEIKRLLIISQCKHDGEVFYFFKCKNCQGIIASDSKNGEYEVILKKKKIRYNNNNE